MAVPAVLLLFLTVFTTGYAALCSAQPFGPCRKCSGMGHRIRTTRAGALKRGRDCRRCDATGLRLRLGRRAWNYWLRSYRRGTR